MGPTPCRLKLLQCLKRYLLLAHEFGHVNYQVAHLSSYMDYYAANYLNGEFVSTFIGHNSTDPSGMMASHYESVWRRCYLIYLRTNGKLDNLIGMLHKIQRLRHKAVL